MADYQIAQMLREQNYAQDHRLLGRTATNRIDEFRPLLG
jgi:hypothetical protein